MVLMKSNVLQLRPSTSESKRLTAVKETLKELVDYITILPADKIDMKMRMAVSTGKPLILAYIQTMTEESAEAFELLLRNILQRLDSK